MLSKIWDNYCKERTGNKVLPLPVIIPLVFYTGSSPHNAHRAIWELCGNQAETMRQIWQSPFALIDVNRLPEEHLTSRVWAGTMEFIMRHRFKQQLSHEIQKIAANLNRLIHEKEGQLVLELLSYIVSIDDEHRSIHELTNIIHELSPEVESEIMSLAEILRDEGKIEEKFAIARCMLNEGSAPAFVAKVTKLPIEDIKALQKDGSGQQF